MDQGLLIQTEITPFRLDGDLVMHHRRIPFVTYPFEWCPAMFKDAMLAMLDLMIELAQHQLVLKDAHLWNLLFDGCQPVFVDFPSIARNEDARLWPAYEDFCQRCLYPLLLMAHGQDQIARVLLAEGMTLRMLDLLGLTTGLILPTLSYSMIHSLWVMMREKFVYSLDVRLNKEQDETQWRFPKVSSNLIDSLNFLKQVRRDVARISLPSANTNCCMGKEKSSTSLLDQEQWTVQEKRIYQMITAQAPQSVLFIGSQTGEYARLAALAGSQVVVFDKDMARISQLYQQVKGENLPILPLMMDFIKPTPARGPGQHWSIAATERFSCELVLAVNVLHELVRTLYFPQIVEGLAAFTKQCLLVEFIPRNDEALRNQWWVDRLTWYTLDNFMAALKQRFCHVRIVPYIPGERVLLLCEK